MSGHLFAAAADRNRHDLLPVLAEWLADATAVLELGGGTGQHAAHFARGLPHLTWQPTETEPALLRSIAAYVRDAGLPNLRAPLPLDIAAPDTWPAAAFDAAVCINVLHIAPWAVARGLMTGVGARLPAGGRLVTYGPYLVDGQATTDSNAAFDASLREQHPGWGLRDVADVEALAADHGLRLVERRPTPVNNFSLRFEKT